MTAYGALGSDPSYERSIRTAQAAVIALLWLIPTTAIASSAGQAVQHLLREGGFAFLEKPFTIDEFLDTINRAVAARD